MPTIAFALSAVFGVLGFGWRSWEQRRRTGSTGFNGVSGRLGSAELFAGVGFVAALVAAVLAPVLQGLVWWHRRPFCTHRGARRRESR